MRQSPILPAPKSPAAQTILWRDFRVTVLSDRLFRIEEDSARIFNDRATQSVLYRDFPPVPFRTGEADGTLTVATDVAALTLSEDSAQCFVLLGGVRHSLDNSGNLLGTTRTLDCFDGEYNIRDEHRLTLSPGVCSRNGVAVLDDTASLTLDADGCPDVASPDRSDRYVFAYGHDYRAAVLALYRLTGLPCCKFRMLPRKIPTSGILSAYASLPLPDRNGRGVTFERNGTTHGSFPTNLIPKRILSF